MNVSLRDSVNALGARLGLRTPRGVMERYQDEFPATARAFLHWLDRIPPSKTPTSHSSIGVVVMPWVRTAVPWYSIALAFALQERGRRVTLLWNDLPFPTSSSSFAEENETVGRALDACRDRFPRIRLGALAPSPLADDDHSLLAKLADQNLIWRLRGANPTPANLELRDAMRVGLRETLARAYTLLRQHGFGYLVEPGGVYGGSSVILRAGQSAGVRVATYDANLGVMQIASEGIAAQQSDIPSAYQTALTWAHATRARAIALAQDALDERMRGSDAARYQAIPAQGSSPHPAQVLIPLNVEFDSAALGRHLFFADSKEWVLETVAFILANFESSIVIRQHPSERHAHERGRFDLRSALAERFPDEPRVRFVAAEDPINTYDLVNAAQLVLPFASTIGYEAAALNKRVVVAGASCYSDLDFVYKPASREDYFALVSRGLKDDLPVLPNQSEHALLCYYLTPVCARLWTNFTPQPPDYWKWIKRAPVELFADPAVQDIVTALDDNIPLALVRHARAHL